MPNRVYNFSAGPAMMPVEVVRQRRKTFTVGKALLLAWQR